MSQRYGVFLSASIPKPGRRPFDKEIEKYNIREAIVALVSACKEINVDLVFAGHPVITPLVHHAARASELASKPDNSTGEEWRISIYQSDHFVKEFPPDVLSFQEQMGRDFRLIPASESPRAGDTPNEFERERRRQMSKCELREAMITEDERHFIAGIFIGGMEGNLDEFARLGRARSSTPRFPIASTGGAARMGWPEPIDWNRTEVLPPDHARPPLPPLLEPLEREGTLREDQLEILRSDRDHPATSMTYRTLFRRLLRSAM